MKYITKYSSLAGYKAAKAHRGYPNVSLVEGETNVRYNMEYVADNPLTFTAQEDGQFKFTIAFGSASLSYSLDSGETWSVLSSNTWSPTVTSGSTIQWSGNMTTPVTFASTGRFAASGKPSSLLADEDVPEASRMFENCTGLTDAIALELTATTLTNGCYQYMFNGCTSLTAAPQLPATTLANRCYVSMFFNCTSLTTAPALPATTLADNCYSYMFRGCTSLTTAPALPATTLVESCYEQMFNGCTSLTATPVMTIVELSGIQKQCRYMFKGCSSMTTSNITINATNTVTACYEEMFNGCTSLRNAPALPATVIASWAYYQMFNGCSNINSMTCLATEGFDTYNAVTNWTNGVAANGTFTKAANATWPTGASGIPQGWTVVDA